MEKNDHTVPCFRFGVFDVDPRAGELRKSGTRISLQGQPLQVLVALLERPGEVVTREDLRRRIWPEESFGDFDHAVHVAVGKIRAALADSADAPRYVETLPRRGYRFVFPVTSPTEATAVASVDGSVRPARKSSRVRAAFSTTATIAIVGLALSIWWFFSRKPRVLTENDTIILADFTNSTGDRVFDGTLRQGLSVQLEQSPFLKILSDQRIQQTLQMMGQKPDAKLTPGIARELCQRTASAAVLDGSIAQIGSQYLLTLKAVRCSNGNFVASTVAQARDKDHVLDALGKIASEIRKKLGESLTTVQKFDTPLVQATTSSLEALKAFSSCARSGGVIDELPMLQRAIELDPNFAAVYGQLADYYSSLGEAEQASEYAQKAFDRRKHVSERERLAISATYYFTTLGDLEQEQRIWPVLEQMYPRDWGSWNNSSCTRRSLGDYDRALRDAQEALRLAPDQSNPYLNTGLALLFLNRRDEVKQIVKGALASGLDVSDMYVLLYQVAFLENDTKEMEAQLATLSRRDVFEALFAQSSTEAYFGRMRNSLEFSRRAVDIARRRNFNELGAQVQNADALREADFGNPGQARRAAATALDLSSGRRAKLFSSLALARAGDVTRAETLANELNRQFTADTLLQRYWLPTIRGAIELARHNPAKAIDALESVSYELGDVGFSAGNLYPAYLRGQAYLDTRQGKEAAAEYQKFLDHRSIVLNSPLGALAHLGLARAYSLQGDSSKARGSYEDFLTLWKEADPDIPILKAAKVEYARLP
jgi:DNA-binding winged helix-turn-helix (wHTH) protein/tetratricopeptide (TPR) repeat protein